jgi:hypothetical protein
MAVPRLTEEDTEGWRIIVTCRGGEEVAVSRERAVKCAFLLGIIEECESDAPGARWPGSAHADADASAPLTVQAPLQAPAVRAVLRILDGERASAVLEWNTDMAAALAQGERGRATAECEKARGNDRALGALVEVLMAASFLHAPVAEDAVRWST